MSAIAAQGAEGRSAASGQLELWDGLQLADPWLLGLLVLVPIALWWGRAHKARAAGRAPALPSTAAGGLALPRSLRQRLGFLPLVLQGLGLAIVVLALARPLRTNSVSASVSEGVDIALVIDRSSSMQFRALDEQGRKTRLDVVIDVVGEFAERRMTDREGAADRIGLVSFAKYPELVCPFTLDVEGVHAFLQQVEIVEYGVEDGTAIGMALAKAVAVLRETEADSKVVVLLTDGENNVLDIEPTEAARLAADQGVRVYTVLAGRLVYEQDLFGRVRPTNRQLDETELRRIAELTDGRFFRARDKAALEQCYADIEQLVRTEREERRYIESFDLYPRCLAAALALYGAAWLLSSTWLRRLT